jgi:serine/threonine-protein kinase
MLVGEPPHVGNSVQAIVAKILSDTPAPVERSRQLVPPNVNAAVQRAIAKSPADRFPRAADFSAALANPAFTLPGTAAARAARGGKGGLWNPLSAGLAALAAVATLIAIWALSRPDQPAPVVRYSIALAEEEALAPVFGSSLALSPDGSRLVYAGPTLGGGNQLWLRERNELNATPLPGTEGGYQPFFSPDGQRVGFLIIQRARELNVVSLTGEPPVTLMGDSVFRLGGSWGPDGFIYFSMQPDGGLARIPATGGAPEVVSVPDTSSGERRLAWPHALPSGRGVIVTVEKGNNLIDENDDVGVVDLETGETRVLVRGVWGRYSPTGHLVFLRFDGALLAAPFDQNTLEVTGPAVPLLGDVAVRRGPDIALSEAGTLIYATGEPAGQLTAEIVWVDRSGRTTPVEAGWTVTPNAGAAPRLSPDGRRIALSLVGPEGTHVWIKQLGGSLRRLTFEGGNFRPQWTPDGESILYSSNRISQFDAFRSAADGRGGAELILDWDLAIWAQELSPDGQWVVLHTLPRRDIYALRLGVDSTPQALLTADHDEAAPVLSPDGRWLAYASTESGVPEVYVAPFPNVGDGKWQVSRGGGLEPMWSRSGDELFFVALGPQDELAAVSVTTQPTFSAGEPTSLFPVPQGIGRQFRARYDVSLDGQRFLTYRPAGQVDVATEELIVVENFFEELKEKMGKR